MARGVSIRVRGLVQGVGFRPTVWRIAKRLGLAGEVLNDSEGVLIRAFGPAASLAALELALVEEAPPLARIDAIETAPLKGDAPADFRIVSSRSGDVKTGIVPDAATCRACLADIRDPQNRRYRYPFTNCTHCGPRLSIVRAIPYDRATTSMAAFAMCPACLAEYRTRPTAAFMRSPNACPVCGPRVWLEYAHGQPTENAPHRDAIDACAALILSGAIVAIKGIGGFHLACDAANAETVARLRSASTARTSRLRLWRVTPTMIGDYALISEEEAALLAAPAAPIVLLERKESAELCARNCPRPSDARLHAALHAAASPPARRGRAPHRAHLGQPQRRAAMHRQRRGARARYRHRRRLPDARPGHREPP